MHIHLQYCLLALSCYGSKGEPLQETIWPVKPKVFTIWPFVESLPTHSDIQKEENRPVPCIQWIRKEVAPIFSTFQSPNSIFSLVWMHLVADLMSVTTLSLHQGSHVEKVRVSQTVVKTSSTRRTCHHIIKASCSYRRWSILICRPIWIVLPISLSAYPIFYPSEAVFSCLVDGLTSTSWMQKRSGGFPPIGCTNPEKQSLIWIG